MSISNGKYRNPLSMSYVSEVSKEIYIPSGSAPFNLPGGRMSTESNSMDADSIVDKLWKKMFEKPAIIPCAHCNSHNAYTNPVCVSCGAPMGNSNLR